MRTILAIIFMTFSTQVSAFEVKLSQGENEKARGKFLIENLLVGVKALVNSYDFCVVKEELFIYCINEFYTNYKKKCMNFSDNVNGYSEFLNLQKRSNERIVNIIEAIVDNSKSEETAVNIPNLGHIKDLPNDIVVEVPAEIDASGAKGIDLKAYPKTFCSLLSSQVGCIRMTTEAILNKSKNDAYHALLADPVVDNATAAEKLLNTMLELQSDYLAYLN